ncbi:hypothetical protein QBC40DRAFT_74005 [Triangularia verruculosa]|uniref:Uncharacterized protein n=1 Tax=Triangularia verruculosa TaxID=2587418 RepID=A0AAN6XG89_9PEZI|nr:hypothetical protein QBC40DRAFT_74005 [Triangularia verruculosa]
MTSTHHGSNLTGDSIEHNVHPDRVAVMIRDNLPELQSILYSFHSKATGRSWMLTTAFQTPLPTARRPRVYMLGLPLMRAESCDYISAIPRQHVTWLSVTGSGSFVTLNMLKQRLVQTHSLETLHLRNFSERCFEFSGNERLPPLHELVLENYDWQLSREETVNHWDFARLKVLMLFSVKHLEALLRIISQVPHALETMVFDMKWSSDIIPILQALCECSRLHTVVVRLPLKLPTTNMDLLQQLQIPVKDAHDNLAYKLAAGIISYLLRNKVGDKSWQDVYVLFGEWKMWDNAGVHPGYYFKYIGPANGDGIHIQNLNLFNMEALLETMARMASANEEGATTLDDARKKKARQNQPAGQNDDDHGVDFYQEMYGLRYALASKPLDRISLSF